MKQILKITALTTAIVIATGVMPHTAFAANGNGHSIVLANQSVDIDYNENRELKQDELHISSANEMKALKLSAFFQLPITQENYRGISQGFSRFHNGIDVRANLNAEIHPISEGRVVETGFERGGYGNFIMIEHSNGMHSLYSHMAKRLVKTGDEVFANTVIGTVGLTGRTTGPHIHLEIHKNGKYLNPATFVPLGDIVNGGTTKLSASGTSISNPRAL